MWDYVFGALVLILIAIAYLSACEKEDDEKPEKSDDIEF